jgi:hypothetical protein
MLAIQSMYIEKGRKSEFKKWVAKNISKFREFYGPLGWDLKGIYTVSNNLGQYDVIWIWEFKRYGDIDTVDKASDSSIEKLLDEEYDFYMPGPANTSIYEEIKGGWIDSPARSKRTKNQARA